MIEHRLSHIHVAETEPSSFNGEIGAKSIISVSIKTQFKALLLHIVTVNKLKGLNNSEDNIHNGACFIQVAYLQLPNLLYRDTNTNAFL